MSDELKDCYYSAKAAYAIGRVCVYEDESGAEVRCTEVITRGRVPLSYRWGDLEFVGTAIRWVRNETAHLALPPSLSLRPPNAEERTILDAILGGEVSTN